MAAGNIIPSFDIYKTLDNSLHFIFSRLEETYNPYDASLPHRHNYYEVLLFNQSGGIHEIDFNVYKIHKNTIHFVSPEQVHVLRRHKQVTGYVMSFSEDFFLASASGNALTESLPFFNNPYASPVLKITAVQLSHITQIISQIHSEFNSTNADRAEMLHACLAQFLITARRMYHDASVTAVTAASPPGLTHKFKMLAHKNFIRYKSVADYAALLNITPGHLNDSVHRDTGKSASEIIHDRIILEAKRLLYHSPKSVKEIAAELLYDDPSYFSRFFKARTGASPEQFRRHIREKYQ